MSSNRESSSPQRTTPSHELMIEEEKRTTTTTTILEVEGQSVHVLSEQQQQQQQQQQRDERILSQQQQQQEMCQCEQKEYDPKHSVECDSSHPGRFDLNDHQTPNSCIRDSHLDDYLVYHQSNDERTMRWFDVEAVYYAEMEEDEHEMAIIQMLAAVAASNRSIVSSRISPSDDMDNRVHDAQENDRN